MLVSNLGYVKKVSRESTGVEWLACSVGAPPGGHVEVNIIGHSAFHIPHVYCVIMIDILFLQTFEMPS